MKDLEGFIEKLEKRGLTLIIEREIFPKSQLVECLKLAHNRGEIDIFELGTLLEELEQIPSPDLEEQELLRGWGFKRFLLKTFY